MKAGVDVSVSSEGQGFFNRLPRFLANLLLGKEGIRWATLLLGKGEEKNDFEDPSSWLPDSKVLRTKFPETLTAPR